MFWSAGRWGAASVLAAAVTAGLLTLPQRSAAQSSQASSPATAGSDAKGQQLLDEMVQALGGDAWRNRRTWTAEGRAATFYKGRPNEGVIPFELYHRSDPFAERMVVISKQGVFIPTEKRDVVELWTGGTGYEITYRGKKELPKEIVTEFERRRTHSLETLVGQWLKAPGVLVVYGGTSTLNRRIVDVVTVLTANNDAMTVDLDVTTHLPLASSFEVRNEQYKDHDSYREEYDDYHVVQGVMTALTVTRYKNDDMTGQRFFTKFTYGTELAPALFDADVPLKKK